MTAIANALTQAMTSAIVKAAGAWSKAEDQATRRRVDFGRAVGKAQVAIVAAGGSAEDAESEIWPVIVEAIGYRVDWKTILDWTRAANVYDSLPRETADALSTEALKTIGRVPVAISDKEKEAGKVDRATFAAAAVESGQTSVRDLRKAVSEERATSSPKKEKRQADQASGAVQALKTLVSEETQARFADCPSEVLEAAVMIGVMLRDKCPKHNVSAVAEAVAQFFGPEPMPVADGSGADDDQ